MDTSPTDHRIRNVVVLGGGTAGWMTASYVAKAFQGTVKVTVLEAPAIPRIGVGEATVPNLHRAFFSFLGIEEDEWMRECNASFKMAVKFVNWRTEGEGVPHSRDHRGKPDHFYHTFGILPAHERLPLSHYWDAARRAGRTDEQFDYACYREPAVMDAKLSPRDRDGNAWTNYAWHFDAHLVADFLSRFATKTLGVDHVQDRFTEAVRDERGFVTALKTEAGRTIEGDLFVDCSGFRGLLINQVMREPFLDMSDYLMCDSAVAASVPHDDEANGVEPYTSSIAMKSGWTWKIPMLGRFGSGYVFSSRFTDRDTATEDFCRLWGLDPENTDLNHVSFRVGRNRRAWVKNVVSVGLASCFVEPLESTGIYFTYAAAYQLVKHFPDKNFDPVLTKRFNAEIETMFDDTRDFLQAHFKFAPRNDTPFWRENKNLVLDPGMQEKVDMYRAGLPVNQPVNDEATYYDNFEAEFRNFWTNGSFYCIFSGLDFLPERTYPYQSHRPADAAGAEPIFARIAAERDRLLETLPTTYEFLRGLHGK
ncbi:tryptophan 7-halogenase [Glycomyces sp. A-F 0318]|uniref:tryptophan halogenase family protein n=1 Tax=Glycomyces amatae TaxID=2881355 RepID=UPI001E4074FD|nr:tryptophan halogenase family protein [Glycomyces amatae]MCD0444090.1 tryptophan 7-halogenase [Glycomyces amatae]